MRSALCPPSPRHVELGTPSKRKQAGDAQGEGGTVLGHQRWLELQDGCCWQGSRQLPGEPRAQVGALNAQPSGLRDARHFLHTLITSAKPSNPPTATRKLAEGTLRLGPDSGRRCLPILASLSPSPPFSLSSLSCCGITGVVDTLDFVLNKVLRGYVDVLPHCWCLEGWDHLVSCHSSMDLALC